MKSKKAPVYLVTGEAFKREGKINEIVKNLIGEKPGDFGLAKFFAPELDIKALLEQAQTYPFISSHQVLLIKNVSQLQKDQSESLEAYLRQPAEFTTLILEDEDVPKKSPLYKAVKKSGEIFSYKKARTGDVTNLILRRARAAGRKISPEALEALKEETGGDLALLDQALDRILAFAGKDRNVTEETVRRLADNFAEPSGFDLTDAIARKDTKAALRIFLRISGDTPYGALETMGLINWQLKRIWNAKRMMRAGMSRNKIGESLRIPPYFISRFLGQVKSFSEKGLEDAFRILYATDIAAKSGRTDAKTSVETLLIRLTA